MSFRTHTGEVVDGSRLQEALDAVATWLVENTLAIRAEDCYADHITEAQKDEHLREGIDRAVRIRAGTEPWTFWLWQRVDTHLTGECVPFLAPVKGNQS